MANDIISAGQVVGKTLFALKEISIYRSLPTTTVNNPVYKVPVGQAVGIVYSWVERNGILFWQFIDKNERPYYAPHAPGAYSLDALKQQGAKTSVEILQEKKDKEAKEADPVGFYAEKYIKMGIYGLLGIFAVQALFNSFKSK